MPETVDPEKKSRFGLSDAFWQALAAGLGGALFTALLTVQDLKGNLAYQKEQIEALKTQGEKTQQLAYETKYQVTQLATRLDYGAVMEKPRQRDRN